MYERSAIVLERYMEKMLNLNKDNNLKKNNENYNQLINEIENYQNVTEKELEVIQEFDDIAKEIENLQKEQSKLYKVNKKLEEERAQLFTELGEEAEVLEIKLKRIEQNLEKNNQKLRDIRIEFIKFLTNFSKKQINRNKCEKARRIGEANHISYIEKMKIEFQEIDIKDVVALKDFINFEKEQMKQEALNIMIKNGKSEKVSFNEEVLKRAIKTRIDIAEKEAECYVLVYDKMKKLLAEPDSEAIRLNKYKKTLRDTSVKLAFLKAQKEYIVGFLDYERMTAVSGPRVHKKMMVDACNNFELDIMQIDKLYELIIREINNRSTKKGYNQLYNKTYLKHIEDKEKNFEQEVNNVNISTGTVINSNYWRIEGIKNIYNIFQDEVSTKFNKDLSAYRIDDIDEREELKEIKLVEEPQNRNKEKKEEHYKQFKYDENGGYDEYDYEEEEEEPVTQKMKYDNYEEEDNEELEAFGTYQYKIDDYNFKNNNKEEESNYNYKEEDEEEEDYNYSYKEEDEEEEDYNYSYKEEDEEEDYNYNYKEEDEEEEDYNYTYKEDEEEEENNNYGYEQEDEEEEDNYNYEEEKEEEPYKSYSNPSYQYHKSTYLKNEEYEEQEDYEDYEENNVQADYDEEDYEEYYEDEQDEDDEDKYYSAYSNKTAYKYNANTYLEEDDDDEYENIYEYNYEDDEEAYRKQKLKNKTVISFDDEESIDMIIANSRKKSNNRKNGKGLFNKLFKK